MQIIIAVIIIALILYFISPLIPFFLAGIGIFVGLCFDY